MVLWGRVAVRDDVLALMSRLGPDLMGELGRRALILERVGALAPVGRRALASLLSLSEREVRAAAMALKEQGLLSLDAAGMTLTDAARELLPEAQTLSRAMYGLTGLEQALCAHFRLASVTVVPGDSDRDPQVLREVGRAGAHRLRKVLQSGMTLAVTGGKTLIEVAHGMAPTVLNVMVVPARGGMGNDLEIQASAVASEIAGKLGGHYRVMHMPDSLDAAALQEVIKLPEVREAIELLQRADVVLHGVGRADVMSRQRSLPPDIAEKILRDGAVGETFGDFVDRAGRTVYRIPTVSDGLGTLQKGKIMLAVAAGSRKALAIIAALRHEEHDSLITDEGAARAMLPLL
jgi:central glycolytic genes regulator